MEGEFFSLPEFGDVDAAHPDDLSLQNWDIFKGKEVEVGNQSWSYFSDFILCCII